MPCKFNRCKEKEICEVVEFTKNNIVMSSKSYH
jgi:hypothetical protein